MRSDDEYNAIAKKLAIAFFALIALVFVGLFIADEIHNHSPQGRYEQCLRDAGVVYGGHATGYEIQQQCEQNGG